MEVLVRWLIARFGEAVLQWTIQELYDRAHGEEIPHGMNCQCGGCPGDAQDEDFDADELGIDPEAEGY